MTAEQIPRPELEATPPRRRVLDLDALAAEVDGEPLEVRLRGKSFLLPPSMPVGLPIYLNRAMNATDPLVGDEATLAAIEALFGDRAEEAMRAGFSLSSLVRLATTYGVEVPADPETPAEASPASAPSSKPTGTRSKRTSKPTTASTSGPAALAPVRSGSDASLPS